MVQSIEKKIDTWSISVKLAGSIRHQHKLCFILIFLKAPMCCKRCLSSLMVFVSTWTQVYIDTWIIFKLLHFSILSSMHLNIQHIIQVASLTKSREEGGKGRCILPCLSLADYCLLSPFKCTMSHFTTGCFVLSWQRKGEAKKLDHLDLQHSVSWVVVNHGQQQAESEQATQQL